MKSSKTAMLKGCLRVLVENRMIRALQRDFIDCCCIIIGEWTKRTSEPSRADDPMVLSFASTQ